MVLDAITMKTDEDDEPTRWTSIGWQALLITNRLRNKAQLSKLNEETERDANDQSSSSHQEEKRAFERLEFVNRRLRELERFEDRARGRK